jgi:hypothetical protein
MDLSSVCRAAIAAGVSNDKESSIVAFKIVDPPKSYTGVPESKRQRLTTLDYKNAAVKFGGGSWYGLRAFVFVPANEAILVFKRAAAGGEGGHMALSRKQSMDSAKTVELTAHQVALDGGQENMALFFDGKEGTMLTYEGAGEYLAQIPGGITVEAWVYDAEPAERSAYVAFFQDNGGSAESGGDGAWAGAEPLPEEQHDKGFVLGTDKGAFSFALASTDANRLDYLSSQACAARHHLGSWVHLAGTYDGSVMKLYINGVKSAVGYTQSGPVAWPTLDEPAELTLGAWLGTKKQTYFNGMLDEVRIWSKPLPEATINSNMHMTLAVPMDGLGILLLYCFVLYVCFNLFCVFVYDEHDPRFGNRWPCSPHSQTSSRW